jgi:serine/threonine protein phosphatase PrpC
MSLNANRLATAIRLANRQVWKRADERPDFGGMGAAVAAVLIQGDEAAVANLGDSRVYLFREGLLKQLTVDDTWLNVVLADGNLDAAQRARHPMRNVLTQAVGSQNDVDVHTTDVLLRISDLLLLSSDGLHAVVGDDVVRAALANNLPPEDLVERLVHEARAAGGPDNISCVVIGVAHS